MKQNPKPIESIRRATAILLCLHDNVGRITDISAKLNLSHATVYRILRTLEASGLVAQDLANHQYYLGHLFAKLGTSFFVTHKHLVISASQEIKRLWELSHETVILDILIGVQTIRLKELQSDHTLAYMMGRTYIEQVYAGAVGRVLLSELDDDGLELVLKNIDVVPLTPKTITDTEVLVEKVRKVREQGYEISFGERIQGGAAISVPIKNYVFPAALSIVGPENRWTTEKMMRILKDMMGSARRISNNLLEVTQGDKPFKY